MLRRRTFQEGTLGLFALLGLIMLGALAVWLRGGGLGQDTYQIIAEFSDVSGLQVGASVNYRGVGVGKIAQLRPSSNGVEVVIELTSSLRIPRETTVQINRSGLIGEASVDLTPPNVTLAEQALAINPNSDECPEKQLILCHNDRLVGESGSQLMSSLTRLSNVYSDPKFVANLNAAAQNAAQAGQRLAKLSDEVALLSKTARREIQGVSETLNGINRVSTDASVFLRDLDRVILDSRGQINQTFTSTAVLVENLNGLVAENRGNLVKTLNSVEQASSDLRQVAINLDYTTRRLNEGLDGVNTQQMAKDLEVLIANASATSANLRDASQRINDPTVLLTLQKTLDSARVTFENAEKITSDVEEFTGDPAFRANLKRLVNGLSSLVSFTEQLEQQAYSTHVLESATQQLEYQLYVQQQLPPANEEVNQAESPAQTRREEGETRE